MRSTVRFVALASLMLAPCAKLQIASGTNKPPRPTTTTSSGITVTASSPSAEIKSSVSLSANKPVKWSLVAGSLGKLQTVDARHATYTAPASIPIQTQIGGCPVLPNDSVFNTPIENLPVHAQSANWLSQLRPYPFSAEPLTSANLVTGTYTRRAMKFYYGGTPGNYPMLTWPNRKREDGSLKSKDDGADHHTLTVTTGSNPCHFYELYNDAISPTYSYGCQDGSSGCNAQSGFDYTPTTYTIPALTTDAAGLPETLAVRADEIRSGTIHHAMRFTLARGYIQGAGSGATLHALWPSSGGNGWGGSNTPPYGARLRLKSTFNLSGHSPYTQNILRGLRQYGTMVADVGSTMAMSFASDIWEDPAVSAAVFEAMAALHGSDFEIVDEAGLMLSPNSAQVNAAKGGAIGFAQILATDPSNPANVANVPVPLLGVGVGLANAQASAIASGIAYSYNFGSQAWVTGSSDQRLTWSLVSGPGSVTSAGVYTLPPSVSTLSRVELKAVSAADSNASATEYLDVYPASPDGHFRITLGSSKAIVDGNKNIWWPGAGLETGIQVRLGGDWPRWANVAGKPEAAAYEAVAYTYGADIHIRLITPNGPYRVRMLFGSAFDGCTRPCTFNPSWNDPLYIGTNGVITSHNYHWNVQTGEKYGIAWQLLTPADVVAHVLDYWIGGWNPDGGAFASSPKISALDVYPDTAAPALTIDTGNEGFDPTGNSITPPLPVAAGSTVHLYAIAWHMGNQVAWSVSGLGSIDQNGVYIAPATVPAVSQAVTITAKSTVNPSVSATATLKIVEKKQTPASGHK